MEILSDKLVIEIQGKIYTLIPKNFDDVVEIEQYIKIDYSNIMGELIVMPLIINQISNLRAEVQSFVSRQKNGLKILEANLEQQYKASRLGAKTTIKEVENHVIMNEGYQEEQELLIKYEKWYNYLDGFYWSAKAKLDTINTLSERLIPEEFNIEVLEKSVNNVLIKKFNGKL